jgi:hypothetical protein
MPRATDTMKVTTVRFGTDLWALLESEAARVGVSTSQYIREASLARAAASAAGRVEAPFELLAGALRETSSARDAAPAYRRAAEEALGALARLDASEQRSQSAALIGQSEQAQRMAASKKSRSEALADQSRARR